MAEIATASVDDVRVMQRRRSVDEAGMRLSLQAAELGAAWVARDDGEPIAIAIAHDSEDERYVGDLFVEPSYRGQGLGGGLLAAALENGGDRGRTMLLDPSDAAAFALAFRYGMAPREPILRFAGPIPREEQLAKMAAGDYRFSVEAIDPGAEASALNELDRNARGVSRPGDHEVFARDASGYAFLLNGEDVGYAYVWPDGRVGPLASASQAYLVQIFAFALVTLQRQFGASWCALLVPGSNRRIARAALRAGLRIDERLLVARDSVFDGSAYVANHRLLL